MASNLNQHQVFSRPDKPSKPCFYKAEHLSLLEQKKTATSLKEMIAMTTFDGSKQRGNKQPSWSVGSLTSPLPSSWTPTIAIHLSPAQHSSYTLPNNSEGPSQDKLHPSCSHKSKPASAPECKTSSSCTSTSQHHKPHQDVPTPNCRGDEVSARKLLGELWGLQLAHSRMKL